MKVLRTAEVDAASFQVGDIISFTLTNGEEAEAMAVKQEQDGMVFCFVDCLYGAHPMKKKNINCGGYEISHLRDVLNGRILDRFPADLREKLLAFDNGDLLRIPTEREIFGDNVFSEIDDKEQWEPMKLRRNRIACQGKNGGREWYWLMDCKRGTAASFARVYSDGNASYDHASYSNGVRPVFKLPNDAASA